MILIWWVRYLLGVIWGRGHDSWGNLTQSTDWGEVNADLSDKDAKDNVEVNAAYAQSSTTKAVRLVSQNVQSYDANGVKDISSKAEYYYDSNGALGTIGVGLPTKTIVWSDASTSATTTMNYDVWGNALNVQDARVNAGEYGGNTAVNTYDNAYHAQLLTQTNALGQTTTLTYDTLSRPATATDPNGNVQTSVYDALNRAVKSFDSIDSLAQPTVQTDYFLVGTKWYTRTKAKTSGAATVDSYTYTDGLGRTIQTKKQAVGGWITQDYYWDASGRNYQISVPYLTVTNPTASGTDPFPFVTRDATQKQTVLNFDKLDRAIKLTHADGSFAQTSFQGNTVTTTDENDHVTKLINAPGQMTLQRFTGTSAAPVLYSQAVRNGYRSQAQLIDNVGNTLTSVFDNFGRRTSYTDTDTGTWVYTYDVNGNLKTQTDSKNQTITYTYDKLNRLIAKSSSDSSVNVTYNYDETGHEYAVGRMTSVSYNRGSDSYTYDLRGRVVSLTRTLDGITKTESATYDSADRKVTETLPDGEVLNYGYLSDGKLNSLAGTQTYLSSLSYNALGQVKTAAFGNGVTTSYNYYDDATVDPTSGLHHSYLLRQILAGSSNSVMNLTYSYDKLGMVKTRTDGNDSTKNESYGYDEFNRLVSWTFNGLTQSFAYNTIDNLTNKDGLTYSYYASHPHQVQSFGSNNYTYDAAGNMITKSSGRTITYDAENRVTNMSDGGSYAYDPGRQRTIKTEGSKTTYYFFGNYQEEYTSGALSDTIKYYSPNGVSVAERSTTQGLLFIHSDHLGSSSKMTNAAGIVVKSQGFKPFGGTNFQSGTATTKYQYTGHEQESNDLVYMNSRYYDPELGRFTQTDPAITVMMISDAGLNWQEYSNSYLYARNNPIVYSDPTGLDVIILHSPWEAGVDANGLSIVAAGHLAILVGDDENGWVYYSNDGMRNQVGIDAPAEDYYDANIGYRPHTDEGKMSAKFATANFFFNQQKGNKQSRKHSEFVRFPRQYSERLKTSRDQDNAMQYEIAALIKEDKPYNLITNNCSENVTQILNAGGVTARTGVGYPTVGLIPNDTHLPQSTGGGGPPTGYVVHHDGNYTMGSSLPTQTTSPTSSYGESGWSSGNSSNNSGGIGGAYYNQSTGKYGPYSPGNSYTSETGS